MKVHLARKPTLTSAGLLSRVVIVSYRLKPALVTLGWGTSLAAITLWAVFQGLLLPRVQGGLLPEVLESQTWRLAAYYAAIFGVSVLAAIILSDFGKALASFFASYGLGAVITYWVLALPGFTSPGTDVAFRELLVRAAIDFTFRAFFPFPLFLELMATTLGVALAERFS